MTSIWTQLLQGQKNVRRKNGVDSQIRLIDSYMKSYLYFEDRLVFTRGLKRKLEKRLTDWNVRDRTTERGGFYRTGGTVGQDRWFEHGNKLEYSRDYGWLGQSFNEGGPNFLLLLPIKIIM